MARIESTDPSGFIITALNRRYVAENAGRFEIEEYSPEPRMMHTKMMVIDRRLAVMTSTNLDHRAFWHDTENGMVFLDTPQVGQLLRLVESYRQTTRRLGPKEPETAFGQALYNWRWLRSIF
ncbi:MAG: phospholipase D-like domain-containing protein [Maritimibacter sp.]